MDENLQKLEVKIENQGSTPQGKVSAAEWNILVAAVKALDAAGIDTETLAKYLKQYQYITTPELEELLKDVTENLDGVVDLKSAQVIEGLKDFVNGIKLGGILIRYDAETNTVFIPCNLLVEKGFAFNSSINGFTPQTITDSVKIDGVTIRQNADGALYVVGGGGTGGEGGGFDESQLADYLASNGYITSAALTPYATTSYVITALNNYAPLANTLAGYGIADAYTRDEVDSAITAAFNAFATDISNDGIVNTYKELIDYAATHGAELTTLVGQVANKADKATTLAGYGITDAYTKTEADSTFAKKATTLAGYGITDAYTKTEIAASFVDKTSAQSISGIKDFANGLKIGGVSVVYNAEKNALILPCNLLVEKGMAFNSSIDGFTPQTITDAVKIDGVTIRQNASGELYAVGGGGTGGEGGVSADFVASYVSSALTDYLSLSGGTVDGDITSTKFIGDLEGSASKLGGYDAGQYLLSFGSPPPGYDANVLQSNSFVSFTYANNAPVNGTLADFCTGYYGFQLTTNYFDDGPLYYRSHAPANDGGIGIWQRLVRFTENELSPSSGTLTINGDITSLKYVATGIGTIKQSGYKILGNGVDATFGANDVTGGAYIWLASAHALRFGTNGIERARFSAAGYFGVGTTTPAYPVDVVGDIRTSGQLLQASARSLKNIAGQNYLTIEDLMRIIPYRYTWLNGRDSIEHIGGIADEVKGVLPEVIFGDSPDTLAMDYGVAAFVMASSLTPYVSDHDRRIEALERENVALKEEIKKLKAA